MIKPATKPFEEGRQAYIAGISFFENPYFDSTKSITNSVTEWADGWASEQTKNVIE